MRNDVGNVSKSGSTHELLLSHGVVNKHDSAAETTRRLTGEKSTRSFHKGFLRALAKRSQSASFTAPVAM